MRLTDVVKTFLIIILPIHLEQAQRPRYQVIGYPELRSVLPADPLETGLDYPSRHHRHRHRRLNRR